MPIMRQRSAGSVAGAAGRPARRGGGDRCAASASHPVGGRRVPRADRRGRPTPSVAGSSARSAPARPRTASSDSPRRSPRASRPTSGSSGAARADASCRFRSASSPCPARARDDARAAWLARPDTSRLLAQIDEALYSYVLDRDGEAELVYASPRFEALIDSSPAAMASIDAWRARIHRNDRALVRESARELLAGHPIEREYRLRCADGQERVVLDRANPHPPEGGMVTVDGILIDVTERRQAALAYAETSSRLAHIIESIDEYIYTDTAGVDGHLGRPLYASSGIFRVLGRPVPLARLNEAWEGAVHPDDLPSFNASHRRMANGESIEVEYRILRPDGEARWVLDRARPRRTPDGRVLIDGVIADVTERRRVADELAAARDEADRRSRVDALTGRVQPRALHRGARRRARPGRACERDRRSADRRHRSLQAGQRHVRAPRRRPRARRDRRAARDRCSPLRHACALRRRGVRGAGARRAGPRIARRDRRAAARRGAPAAVHHRRQRAGHHRVGRCGAGTGRATAPTR